MASFIEAGFEMHYKMGVYCCDKGLSFLGI